MNEIRSTGSADPAPGEEEPAHLLVVDDDERIRTQLTRYLQMQGFRASAAEDAAKAAQLMDAIDFDLIVLDVMMPGEDGFSFTRRLRETSKVPIVLLTARGMPEDRIEGLRLGADDYLPKPFEPEELALRIAAILQRVRSDGAVKGGPVQFGPFHFDPARKELSCDGKLMRITEGEALLLTILAATPGEPVGREILLSTMNAETDRAVDVQMARLRRKLEPDAKVPRYVQTVRGVGYRLLVDP